MQLSDKTISILKSFITINPGIVVKKGNILRTLNIGKSVFAKATLDQEFPKDFSIYELGRLLGMLSLRKTADVEFKDDHLVISEGNRRTKFQYSDAEVIVHSEKEIKLPSIDADFKLAKIDLEEILKAQKMLGVKHVAVIGDGERMVLRATNIQNEAESHEIEVGATNKKFRAVFEAENFKLIPNDYDVEVTSAGYAHFRNEAEGLDYFISLDAETSTF
jgi:hypothetical protein